MSFAHYQSVLPRTDIPTGPKNLLCHLCLLLGENNAVWPSVQWMAQAMNTTEKTIKSYLKTLTSMGLLTRFKRHRQTTMRHINVVPHKGEKSSPSKGEKSSPQPSIDQSNNKYIFGEPVETGCHVETESPPDNGAVDQGRRKNVQVKKSPTVDYDFLAPLLKAETLAKWKTMIKTRYGHWPTQEQVNFMVTQCVHCERDGHSPNRAVETQLGMGYPRLLWNKMKFHLGLNKRTPSLADVLTDADGPQDSFTAGESIAW